MPKRRLSNSSASFEDESYWQQIDEDMCKSVPESLQTRPFEGCRDLTIKRQVVCLQRNYKNEYVKPEVLPYKERMARQYYCSGDGTVEDMQRKKMQADISRLSRHRSKFVETRICEDIPNLRRVLHQRIKRMVEMEDFINYWFIREGLSPVNFDEMSEYDGESNSSNDNCDADADLEYADDDESSESENELQIVEDFSENSSN